MFVFGVRVCMCVCKSVHVFTCVCVCALACTSRRRHVCARLGVGHVCGCGVSVMVCCRHKGSRQRDGEVYTRTRKRSDIQSCLQSIWAAGQTDVEWSGYFTGGLQDRRT